MHPTPVTGLCAMEYPRLLWSANVAHFIKFHSSYYPFRIQFGGGKIRGSEFAASAALPTAYRNCDLEQEAPSEGETSEKGDD